MSAHTGDNVLNTNSTTLPSVLLGKGVPFNAPRVLGTMYGSLASYTGGVITTLVIAARRGGRTSIENIHGGFVLGG